jgi:5-formyltetrahydrofolate cyclo-ligase
MVPERFGTMRPVGEAMTPDVLLIPLLAFDAAGHRLGYGGGFYDRTLAGLPGRFRLGCAFATQQVDEVPAGPYDIRLDAVATEAGVIRFAGSATDAT